LSSLFEIPAQLAMLLSLAASTAGQEPAAAVSNVKALPTPAFVERMEGPLRFTERAWLRALYENRHEAEALGSRIFVTSGGRFYVPVASDRQRILDARNDASVATRLARAAADRHAEQLRDALHRPPAATDLYIAHVFGPEAAISLLKAVGETPVVVLKTGFPAMAAGVPEAAGIAAPITVGQFYRRLTGALGEPPRLVAIGLKPTVVDAPRKDLIAELLERSSVVAWQAKVDMAKTRAAQ
jgi:hypothetical protein